jgi:uncharacterized protein (TIGR03083 family)
MEHLEFCDLLEREIGRFATLVADAAPASQVPSCPEWTVSDLVRHLGTVHRWAEHLVRTRSQRWVSPAKLGLVLGPLTAEWIHAGGAALVSTLRSANPNTPMWAWGVDQHVAFWSRRQLHETLVHRIDLELAMGVEPAAADTVAADAIDEFLVNLAAAAVFSPNVKQLRGGGERLVIRTDQPGCAWTITLSADGFDVETGAATSPTSALSGPPLAVLLVLYRRVALDQRVSVDGDLDLVRFWLANSALQ